MPVPSPPADPGQASALRSRLGRSLRWLAWPTVLLWVPAIVVLHPLAGTLYEITDHTAAANLPAAAPSTRVAVLQEAAQPTSDTGGKRTTDAVAVLFVRGGGLISTDLPVVAGAQTAVAGLVGIDGLGAPTAVRTAPDGQAASFTAEVSSAALHTARTDIDAVHVVRNAVATATRGAPGLQVLVTGPAAVTADGGSTSQTTLLFTAMLIVAVLLLVIYRSVLLWIFPLVGAVGGITVAQAATHALGNAGLTVSSLSTSILIVLSFGAASDYALLLIHRYRDELRHHQAVEEAMAVALRRTAPTLAASAATVVGAMLCLLAAQSASLHGLGPVGAVAVLAALAAQISFLPALLIVVGRFAFWPRPPRPGDTTREESRIWSRIGAGVTRHPARICVGAVVLLGATSLGLLALHVDNDPLDNLKNRPESVTGAALFADHYGPGAIAPLALLVPPAQAKAAAATARVAPDVAGVGPGATVGQYFSYSIVLSVDPYSSAGAAAIGGLRAQLDRTAPGSLLGGGPAIAFDTTRAARRDALVLIPLVLVVIFLVVVVLLQALIAPIVLVATTALSFAAALGVAGLWWRYGLHVWGTEAQLPLYIFIFLVALGVDYNIFLTARIREEARLVGTQAATTRGLAVTGGVITAAGVVLAGTFAALTTEPQVNLTVVGTAIAIGVLLDTLLVRTVLVPATLLLLGERAWWPAKAPERVDPPGPRATSGRRRSTSRRSYRGVGAPPARPPTRQGLD